MVSTVTTLRSAPAGVTVHVVTMLEFVSRSTIRSAVGRAHLDQLVAHAAFVACSSQCTRLPAPRPPASTR